MKNENVVVLLTGRGNNTLKDKNILPILGRPLLSYVAEAASRVEGVGSYFVSSDDEKILSAAASLGYIKIIRPSEYSTPTSQHVECLKHAIEIMKTKHNITPTILVVLLANCATVKTEWIEDCLRLIENNPHVTSVIPVQRNNDHHPLRAKRIDDDGYLTQFIECASSISSNRDDLESNYFVCHNFWVLNLRNMKENLSTGQPPWCFMGDKIIPYIVEYSIDVHCEEDIYLTEDWLKNKGNSEY